MSLVAFDAPPIARRQVPWGTFTSLALHAALALAILLISPARQLLTPPPQSVSVDIVTPAQFAALQPQAPTPSVTASPPADDAAPPAQPAERLTPSVPLQPKLAPRPTIAATQFYSAAMLDEPSMRLIRQTMGTLTDGERLVQLCNIEGLEQIRRHVPGVDPDTLVPYAMADMATAGLTLNATGAAFRSRRKWYGISFSCTAAPDLAGVTAFAFELGDPIPQDQWEDHNLNAADDDE